MFSEYSKWELEGSLNTKSQRFKSFEVFMLWSEFLEKVPPNVEQPIEVLTKATQIGKELTNEPITLFCDNEKCGGSRSFRISTAPLLSSPQWEDIFLTYVCKNCDKSYKYYSLRLRLDSDGQIHSGKAEKFGEIPPFGPSTPSKVISLLGPDRELFLKGRRSEVQGLGVGAFAYYRQAVENQKGRLITEVVRVAKRVGTKTEIIQILENAANEQQFSKAVHDIKDIFPDSLKIDGLNPLTLLHNALSKGIHGWSDKDCLGRATAIRVVLTELAGRLNALLHKKSELEEALSTLQNLRTAEEKMLEQD